MTQRVAIVENILGANDRLAEENRARIDRAGVFSINIMALPGAGKTSVILKTIEALNADTRIGVLEGGTAAVTIDADKVKVITATEAKTAVLREKDIPIPDGGGNRHIH